MTIPKSHFANPSTPSSVMIVPIAPIGSSGGVTGAIEIAFSFL